MQNTEATGSSPALPQTSLLRPDEVPIGTPLEWPIVERDGTPLFERGATLVSVNEREFLFENFTPLRGDLCENTPISEAALPGAGSPNQPLTVKDMNLPIGAPLGLRTQPGERAPASPCRVIGHAPNGTLFITPPLVGGRILSLRPGENVEIIAIASQAIFRFVCTVESVCQHPFDYIVLSKPGVIRALRERKSIRLSANLAVRYGIGAGGDTYDCVGLAKNISGSGMSLMASRVLGKVGDRLRVAFHLRASELDANIETSAVIHNVHEDDRPGAPAIHGLELDQLDTHQRMAMKVFMFGRQEDLRYC
ncbi:MAG: hypothetical protein QOI13_1321 [Paraburkholderia sp.]|jgi:c-di-GMP-binding flagellar brake protein YcgR|nr:hypothetical protein [Paraburkholderia sp.]